MIPDIFWTASFCIWMSRLCISFSSSIRCFSNATICSLLKCLYICCLSHNTVLIQAMDFRTWALVSEFYLVYCTLYSLEGFSTRSFEDLAANRSVFTILRSLARTNHNLWRSSKDFNRSSEADHFRPDRFRLSNQYRRIMNYKSLPATGYSSVFLKLLSNVERRNIGERLARTPKHTRLIAQDKNYNSKKRRNVWRNPLPFWSVLAKSVHTAWCQEYKRREIGKYVFVGAVKQKSLSTMAGFEPARANPPR